MKRFIATLLLGFGALAAAPYADARPYGGHGGHGHGGYYHGGARVGVYVGVSPWLYARPYWPYGYYPYAYGPYGYYGAGYYPPVAEQPVVYAEQPQAAPQAQPQQQFWYFCEDSQTYYPHVQNCATPWQRVTPHAPR